MYFTCLSILSFKILSVWSTSANYKYLVQILNHHFKWNQIPSYFILLLPYNSRSSLKNHFDSRVKEGFEWDFLVYPALILAFPIEFHDLPPTRVYKVCIIESVGLFLPNGSKG